MKRSSVRYLLPIVLLLAAALLMGRLIPSGPMRGSKPLPPGGPPSPFVPQDWQQEARQTLEAWTFPGIPPGTAGASSGSRSLLREFDARADPAQVRAFYARKAGYMLSGRGQAGTSAISAVSVGPQGTGDVLVDQPQGAIQTSAYFLTTPRLVVSALVTQSAATGKSHVVLHVGTLGPIPGR